MFFRVFSYVIFSSELVFAINNGRRVNSIRCVRRTNRLIRRRVTNAQARRWLSATCAILIRLFRREVIIINDTGVAKMICEALFDRVIRFNIRNIRYYYLQANVERVRSEYCSTNYYYPTFNSSVYFIDWSQVARVGVAISGSKR